MTRPTVKITENDTHRVATCQTGDCAWTYQTNLATPKVAVEEQARWHRATHRSAS